MYDVGIILALCSITITRSFGYLISLQVIKKIVSEEEFSI